MPKRFGRSFWLGELPAVLALALAVPMQNYARQADGYNYPHELWLLLGLFGVTGFVLAAGYHAALHQRVSRLAAALAAFYALMVDFDVRAGAKLGIIDVVLPGIGWLGTFAVVLLLAYGLGRLVEYIPKRWKKWQAHQAAVMLSLVMAGIFISSLVGLVGYLQKLAPATNFRPASSLAQQTVAASAKRDVYYIVLDRYANLATLAKHYGYDNSEFEAYLRQQGFTVRENAYSNYQFTAPSISSTMRMDYHSDVQSALLGLTSNSYLPYRKMLENSPVSQLFAKAGYDVKRLSSWYGVTRSDSLGETTDPQFSMTLLGRQFMLSDLQSAVLEHTFIAAWFKAGAGIGPVSFGSLQAHDTGQLVLDQLEGLSELAQTSHKNPFFVFAHVLSPHPPYVFDADGTNPGYNVDDNDQGAARELKYVNQLKFVNNQIRTTIETIKASSKVQPVILLQADEGPYPPSFADYNNGEASLYPWEKASADVLKYKYGTLAAAYLPDTTPEQKAGYSSSVNAFRVVFNSYFGTSMPLLPDCSLLYNGKKPFSFYDVTAKLRGNEDPACPAYAAAGRVR